jgi:hypothetical protein
MRALRQRLPYIAVFGLFIQLGGTAASPLALCCASPADASSSKDKDDECCDGLGPGQVCPLHGHAKPAAERTAAADHHAAASPPKPAEGMCVMTNGCKMPDLALLSMLGSGIVPARFAFVVEVVSSQVRPHSDLPLARTFVPDTPPPRA